MRFILSLFVMALAALAAAVWSLAAGMVVSDKRYFLTGGGKLVEEGHPDAATLLFGKGVQIPEETARQYGLEHLRSTTQLSRVEANRAQYKAAKDRGAFEEMRALDSRLPADAAADEADPQQTRVRVGGHAEAHLTTAPTRASVPPTVPAGINGLAIPSGDVTDPHGERIPSSGADAAGVSPTSEDQTKARRRSAIKAIPTPPDMKSREMPPSDEQPPSNPEEPKS
jgi:hypothetical protein